MKNFLSIFALAYFCACGSQRDDGAANLGQEGNSGFRVTSFETIYGDGYTYGPSYSHSLHYDRDSGTVVITKAAYQTEPIKTSVSLSESRKQLVDRALDSIDTAQVQDIYLTDGSTRASSTDGVSMGIDLFGDNERKEVFIDTFKPEEIPAGLYFLFDTSLKEGNWYQRP